MLQHMEPSGNIIAMPTSCDDLAHLAGEGVLDTEESSRNLDRQSIAATSQSSA